MLAIENHILQFIRSKPGCTIQDIAIYTNTTKVNIQYHLKRMENAGLIEKISGFKGHDKLKGRPANKYKIRNLWLPNNYQELVHQILVLLKNQDQDLDYLQNIVHQWIPYTLTGSLTGILNQAIQILRPMNYEPFWEARSQGPTFYFRNCPYSAIISFHPELCEMDRFLIQAITQHKVKIIERHDKNESPHRGCQFSIFTLTSLEAR